METETGPFADEQNFEEELIPFDVRDQSGRRAMFMLIGAVVLLILIAIWMFMTYQSGVRDRAEPPRIAAETSPYKIAVEESTKDSAPSPEIYNVIDNRDTNKEVTVSAAAEAPLPLPKRPHIVVKAPEALNNNPSSSAESATNPSQTQSRPQNTGASQPVRQAQAPVRAPQTGSHVVQVASLRSHAEAQLYWAKIEGEFNHLLLPSLGSDIKRADLGDKGVFYRLRISGFTNKNDAERLCARLKQQNQACFTTRS